MYLHSNSHANAIRGRTPLLAAIAAAIAIAFCCSAAVTVADASGGRQLITDRAEDAGVPPVLAGALVTRSGASAPADAGPSTQNIFNFFYPGVSAPTGRAADALASEMLWAAIAGSRAMDYVPRPTQTPPGATWLASEAVKTAFRALTSNRDIYNAVRFEVARGFRTRFEEVKLDMYLSGGGSGGGAGVVVGGSGVLPGGSGIFGTGNDQPRCCVTEGPMTIVGYPGDGGGGSFGGGTSGGGGGTKLPEDDPS
jgi:hypothetical protein